MCVDGSFYLNYYKTCDIGSRLNVTLKALFIIKILTRCGLSEVRRFHTYGRQVSPTIVAMCVCSTTYCVACTLQVCTSYLFRFILFWVVIRVAI